ncbi:hypothetical protein KVR01_000555 [Diaporthe batatas]|uniref:uncharacterized protein n=1 Tax=Diaporthe batatas TaxID=748121 RepID=UPI001D055C6A|nr:uncharacterized protein KVR01_000555 [Diaporthe batatas]KAG8169810.1 hypothetical protein KVR01_000555 [Diaporthe batatas]
MGSLDKSHDEITILVTGFGPFKNEFPRNPSWDIASSLPEYLPPLNAKSSTAVRGGSLPLPPVRIVLHPEPVRVTYSAVRHLVPKLWQPGFEGVQKIDYVLHIGMASSKKQYVLERLGHRDDYTIPDLDQRLPNQNSSSDDYPWHDIPAQLVTDLDVADIKRRWESYLPDNLTLKSSEDAGHFLCDYIYFNSLATCHRAEKRKTVLFMHVPAVRPEPADLYNSSIDLGREVAIQLLRSLVESELTAERAKAEAES